MKSLLIILLLFCVNAGWAQSRISGKVIDSRTGEALPFVSVYLKNTNTGTTTDGLGNYQIKLTQVPDSLTASFVGYKNQARPIKKGVPAQVINFELMTTSVALNEIFITPGENPAFRIMRQVIAHKNNNDKRKLSAYQFEAYTKMQLEADNLIQKKKKLGLRSTLTSLIDTQKFVTGADGKKMMPLFISEALSDVYYNRDPKKTKENIKATKVTGIGLQDGSLVTQVIGNKFQDYNFYQNWVSVLQKSFISPIADGWKGSYEYDLEDSLLVGNTWCYKIKFTQKRPQDLAFNGYLWIAEESFAIRKIDATVSKSANINFMESIRLIQEEQPTTAGAWLPIKTAITMQVARLSKTRPGFLVNLNLSARNIVVNQPQKLSFFEQPIERLAQANVKAGAGFWEQNRHDSLSTYESQVYAAIDSIRSDPRIVKLTKIATVLATGYVKVGKISLGPYPYLYASNSREGLRLQGGFKTNIDFSKKWEFSGYGAYGTLDKQFKYGANARYIISRRHWSEAGISRREDLQRVGFMSEKLAASPFLMGFSRFGDLSRAFTTKETSGYLQREILQGITQRITFTNREFNPLYNFGFYPQPGTPTDLTRDFSTSELSFFTRYANNEVKVVNDNDQLSLGNGQWPVFTLKYTIGLNHFINSSVDYQRLDLGISQNFVMGKLGNARYRIEAGKLFSPVPYPLLEVHLGNETPFYYVQTFNLMKNFEFASDTYASLHYEQYFEGLLLNSLPLIKRLKWRLLSTSNILYGSLSQQNLNLIPATGTDGQPLESFKSLGHKPYVEVGYGIENIFRVLRVDAIHRLTYLNDLAVRKFGLRFSLQFKL